MKLVSNNFCSSTLETVYIGNKHLQLTFETLSGELCVKKQNGQLVMNFPQYKQWVSYATDQIKGEHLNLFSKRAKENYIDKFIEVKI